MTAIRRMLLTLGLLAGMPLLPQRFAVQINPAQWAADSVEDLPLSLVQAPGGSLLAVLLTGDGGWAAGDQSLAHAFASRNVAVVGLNSPRYLSHRRTPDEAAADLARIIRHFLHAWNRDRVVIVGYSRGADIGPFMLSRLQAALRERVAMLVLLGPGERASFKFGLLDLIRTRRDSTQPAVGPEVAKLRGLPVLCIYGKTDWAAICPSLDQAGVARPIVRSGGHVVHRNEGPALVEEILAALRSQHGARE